MLRPGVRVGEGRRPLLLFLRQAGGFPTTGLGTGVKVASGQPESAGLFAQSVAFFVLQVGRGSPRTPDPAPFYARPLPHSVGAPK